MGTTHTSLKRSDPQPEAWCRFVEFYTGELMRWARSHGLQEADAEDVTQTILMDIRELLQGYQRIPGKSFGSWLFRVTANECRTRLRRRAREAAGAAGLSAVADTAEVAAFEVAEEAEHHRRLLLRAMPLVQSEFPEKTWAAFAALVLEKRPAAEVAARLGIRRGAVHLARHRVIARLKEVVRGLIE